MSIGIGIPNTFLGDYWYWYCQYSIKVLLTTLANDGLTTSQKGVLSTSQSL